MEGREKYLASKAYKRPVGSFTQRDNVRYFARSAHGQNYNRMMDLQQQLPTMTRNDPRVQEFKDRRRTFNRYGKYPMGEMLGYTPQQMQDQYMDLSRDVRQTNKPVYNRMYPLTGGFMDYVQGGGLPGLFIKGGKDLLGNITGMGKDIASAVGITGTVDDTPEEQDDYVARTFGFYPTDVHPPLPVEDEFRIAPPDDIIQTDPSADITETSNIPINPRPTPNYLDPEYFKWIRRYGDDYLPRGEHKEGQITRTIPGRPITPLQEEVVVPEEPLPFDDTGRETGIASLYGQGPSWAETDRRYEDEYRDYIARTGDRTTYEEFARAYERIHQGKPHAGLR